MRLADFYDISLVYSPHSSTKYFDVVNINYPMFSLKVQQSNPYQSLHINGCVKPSNTETTHALAARHVRCHSYVTEFVRIGFQVARREPIVVARMFSVSNPVWQKLGPSSRSSFAFPVMPMAASPSWPSEPQTHMPGL